MTPEDELDEEYRRSLMKIKPRILQINNPNLISQYRLWLDKLSNSTNKKVRNEYLQELAYQIDDGILKAPFTQPPPGVSLTQFQRDSDQYTEDGSWLDISEAGSMLGDGGDCQIGSKLKLEGQELKDHYLKKYQESGVPKKKGDAETKLKIKELIEVKKALKDAQSLTEKWNTKFRTLHAKLKEKDTKNSQLESSIEYLNRCITELDNAKNGVEISMSEQIVVLRTELGEARKSLDTQKTQYETKIKSITTENSNLLSEKNKIIDKLEAVLREKVACYESEIKEILDDTNDLISEKDAILKKLEAQLQEQNTESDGQMKDLTSEHRALLLEKNEKIIQLEAALHDKIFQFENEVKKLKAANEQITLLTQQLLKSDRQLMKCDKENSKRIEKLRIEFELQRKTIEMRMQNDKIEAITQNNIVKQQEFETIIENLEAKYVKLAEALQMETLDIKRRNEEVISGLKIILDKNEITY